MKLPVFTEVVRALPTDSGLSLTLSASELHELLADIEAGGLALPAVSGPEDDLTVKELASALGKSESAVRAEMPRVPGAYKFAGKEWRVPRSAWQAYRTSRKPEPPERLRLVQRAAPSSRGITKLRPPLSEDELARRAASG